MWTAPECGRRVASVRGLSPVDCVERERELEALDGLLDRLQDGVGGLAVIVGPAGIGKTRLLDEVVRRGRDRAESALARAGELECDLAWGVVRQLFYRTAGGSPELFTG